ncbi:MAG: DUF2934 domain-containing protein [Burkholderiales bacterium]
MASRTGKSSTGHEKAGTSSRSARSGNRRRKSVIPHPTDRDPRIEFSDDEWCDMVATAAYFRGEARGFQGGSADEDWYEAEAQLREQFALAEDEADEKAESALDLASHRTQDRSGRGE